MSQEEEIGVEQYFVSREVGRGLRTTATFSRGDFVIEYRGELIEGLSNIRQRNLERDINSESKSFMFEFKYKDKHYW
jgi:hypothetical protein